MEVEVIDNASNDDTIGAARGMEWVTATALDDNVGFARANNLGLARARGRAILVLNPDTVVPRHGLRRCLDELVGPSRRRPDDRPSGRSRRPPRPALQARLSDPVVVGVLLHRPRPGVPWAPLPAVHGRVAADTESGDVESVSGAFMLMRRDALHEVGGFDEQFFMYAEDIDLSLRFLEHGWRVYYWPGRRHHPRRREVERRRQATADGQLRRISGRWHRSSPSIGRGWRGHLSRGVRGDHQRAAARRSRGLSSACAGPRGARGCRPGRRPAQRRVSGPAGNRG